MSVDIDNKHKCFVQERASMPCFGTYDGTNFACLMVCSIHKMCGIVKLLDGVTITEELPQYLTHRNPNIRYLARQKLEELKK